MKQIIELLDHENKIIEVEVVIPPKVFAEILDSIVKNAERDRKQIKGEI